MDLVERSREILEAARVAARMALELPKLLPTTRTSPATQVRDCARRRPRDLALAFEDQRYTWAEVNDRANQYAAWFADHGIRREDVVALMMDNRPDYVFIVTALSKIGAVAALINTNLTGKALTHAISVSHPSLVVVGSEHLPAVEEVLEELDGVGRESVVVQAEKGAPPAGFPCMNEEVDARSTRERGDVYTPRPKDVYCYIYTSGTTGLPKAAIIRNQRMVMAGVGFGHLMHRSGPGDVIYVALPLYHSSGMFLGWGAAISTGAAMALRRKFSVSGFWKDVREFEATSFLYIGELCRYLLNAEPGRGERDHRLRVAVGNGMGPQIWESFQERFGIPVIREFYGATEGNAPIMNVTGRPRMVGQLGLGQAVVRCDQATGELLRNERGFCDRVAPGESGLLIAKISKVMTFDGYVDREATDRKIVRDVFEKGDCYFDSGDLLTLHEGRWLSFADRVGDTYRWKGENVSTAEVSEILGGAPGVQEANVYGVRVPHSEGRAGMVAVAVDDSFDLDGFVAFAAEHLPSYQRPRFVRILRGGMRVTGTFKHQKVDYREEGFDPGRVSDPLYWIDGDRAVPLDEAVHCRIESGEQPVG
jgi:acyl-CoA synthetase (AMP-forming)/AMP-acid ligase II